MRFIISSLALAALYCDFPLSGQDSDLANVFGVVKIVHKDGTLDDYRGDGTVSVKDIRRGADNPQPFKKGTFQFRLQHGDYNFAARATADPGAPALTSNGARLFHGPGTVAGGACHTAQ